ncbi:hypothetical protein CHU98_g11102 [Xylaria longipes]|nr:hypothetical protein CHU98_g11102 [Xylaria longipes]
MDADKSAGTCSDPIVLDDDNSKRMAPKSTPKKRKPAPGSTPSRPFPKRRRLISVTNEVNDGITTPRGFTEILQSDEDDEIAALQIEVSRLKATLAVQSDLSLQVNNLSAENSKLLEKIQQLERRSNHQKSLEDELKCVQSENAQAKQREDALQRKFAVQKQTIKENYNAHLADTMTELREAHKQASQYEDRVQRLDKEKSELIQQLLKADRAHVTAQKKHDELTAELERAKDECAELPELRSKLTTIETQLSTTIRGVKEAQEQVSGLRLQLQESEKSRAALRNWITRLESEKAACEEENKKLDAAITKAQEDIQRLQLSLNNTKKVHEDAKLQRDKAQGELKVLTDDRAVLCRRIDNLEAEVREPRKEQIKLEAQLAVARNELSRLSSIGPNFQVAQQQFEAMNHHMEICPFIQNAEFFDSCLKISREVSKLLGEASGSSDESPTESHEPPNHTPSPSCS